MRITQFTCTETGETLISFDDFKSLKNGTVFLGIPTKDEGDTGKWIFHPVLLSKRPNACKEYDFEAPTAGVADNFLYVDSYRIVFGGHNFFHEKQPIAQEEIVYHEPEVGDLLST